MSNILGLNSFHAAASAAIIVDGKVVCAIPEERLNRVKYYGGFPSLAICECLRSAGLSAEDIDEVAIGRDSSANRHKKLEFVLKRPTKLLNFVKMKKRKEKLDDVRTLIAKACDVSPDKLKFRQHNIEHHLAHTASSYFTTDWDSAASITIDGSGDFVTCMMSECKGNEIDVKHRIYVPHSMGSFYTMVCEFIGYDRYGDEGKVMGLAPLGENTYKEHFQDMINLTDDGFSLNPKYFLPFGDSQGTHIKEDGTISMSRHYSDYMIEIFGKPRERHSEITKRDMDISFGLQSRFEEAYIHLLNLLYKKVPNDRLVLAGGCVLNSVANGMIFDKTPFKETAIHPAAGDDGLAVGAALYVSNVVLKENKRHVMKNAYLGNSYDDSFIKEELDKAGVVYQKLDRDSLIKETTDEIVKGNVIGWFQGNMEWGPRALGCRSILSHPGLPDMKDVLNARIKHRESFRPFAPSVMVERQSEIFEHDHPSPFMLHVYKIKPEWRDKLCAVNHLDNTGRLQSVSREENPLYYDLIKSFESKSGIPIILNTSFNENEPIVCTPKEAIDCFQRTKMDTLVIGSYFCTKEMANESK